MKRGRYIVVKVEQLSGKSERISLHQDILNKERVQELMLDYQNVYLCKRKVGTSEYWWLASHKNKYKTIQFDKTIVDNIGEVALERRHYD